MKCHPSRPPVPEERQINRLHAEKLKRRKDAAEAKAERKRKWNAKHDKACKIARSEGKPRPSTPESTSKEEEDISDVEAHLPGGGEVATGVDSPPVYQEEGVEDAPAESREIRTAAESLVDPSLEGVERESPPPAAVEETPVPRVLICGGEPAAGAETPVLTAPRLQADPRATPSGQSSRGGAVPRARRSATRKRSMSARSGYVS